MPRIYDNSSAISQINAAVAEMIGRMERKLRKKYLSFAAIIYREWLKSLDICQESEDMDGYSDDKNSDDEADDVFTFSSRFHPKRQAVKQYPVRNIVSS